MVTKSDLKKCDIEKPYVLVSYSSKDRDLVFSDVYELQQRGYNIWLDEKMLDKTNASWREQIFSYIQSINCKMVLFYVSKDSLTSEQCYKEISYTMSEEAKQCHILEEVPFAIIDAEPISDIMSYFKGVCKNIEISSLKVADKNAKIKTASKFIKEVFNSNNERIRIHSKACVDRKVDYFADIEETLCAIKRLKVGIQVKEPTDTDSPMQAASADTKEENTPGNECATDVKTKPDDEVQQYLEASEAGDAAAQYNLGNCYYNGEGVEQDYTEAVKWYRAAAEQGNAKAQYNLGVCYENGNGVEQDYAEAVKWYRAAAEQGNAKAQYNLGVCYENGNGVEQDYTEAVKWYREAAEQGNATAQYNLGVCYTRGYGVEQDHAEALKWYRAAAEQGDATAQNNLGYCYGNGHGVEQDHAEAAKWYRLAAEQGNAKAQYNLGICYYNGDGVEQDYAEAVKWYQKAADQGNKSAQQLLGYCYEHGNGVKKNRSKAKEWYDKAKG